MLNNKVKNENAEKGGMLKPFEIGAAPTKPFIMVPEKKMIRPFTMDLEFAQAQNEKSIFENTESAVVSKSTYDENKELGASNDCLKYSEVNKKVAEEDVVDSQISVANLVTEVIRENTKKGVADRGNFKLRLNEILYKIRDTADGENIEIIYKFTIVVQMLNGRLQSFETLVKGNNVKRSEWVINATRGLATECKSKVQKKWFSEMVQAEIESSINCRKIYPTSGWRNSEYGMIYVYSEGAVGAEGRGINSVRGYSLNINRNALASYNTFCQALNMTKICHSGRGSTLIFLYYHASLLTTLFEKAGFPINFVFGVIGITGSRKTSMCTAMAQLFNRDRLKVDAEFTSTACGIEQTLSKYGDAIVIIDDFILGETATEQAQMAKKLQTLIRLCGNRVSKERMSFYSQDNKKPYFPVKGCCLLTGEQITGITSSIGRMFITNIERDDVQNDLLSFYQENIWLLPTHTYDFLQWCHDNFERILEFIKNNFDKIRKSIEFRHPRYAEMYATFYIVVDVFWWYAFERGFADESSRKNSSNVMKSIVLNELRQNEIEIVNREPGTILLRALDDAIKNMLCEVLDMTLENSERTDVIFEDKNFYYIRREELGRITFEYIKKYNLNCCIRNDKSIITQLEAKNVLDINIDSKGNKEKARKLPYQQKNAGRYLWINKKKFEKSLIEISQ